MSAPSSGYAQFIKTRKFESLDGLRCFSILAVVWHHATEVGKGYLGVQVFFAISGFLITTLLLRERHAHGTISLSKFYARRSLRIFPLYYAVLLIYIVLVYFTQRHTQAGQEFFHNLPFFATYSSNWFVPLNGRVIFYYSWSLATEEQFYLIMPSLEKFLPPTAVWLLIFALGIYLGSGAPLGIVAASTPICFGVVAAHLLDNERTFPYLATVTHPQWCSLAWLIVVIGCAWISAHEVILALAMALLVVSTVVRPDHWLAWLFNWPPFQAVGRVSYGMYMLHQLCLAVLKKAVPMPPWALFACGSVAAYLVAIASYRYFESFFLRIKERFSADVDRRKALSTV